MDARDGENAARRDSGNMKRQVTVPDNEKEKLEEASRPGIGE
jgi:hypothetical protein